MISVALPLQVAKLFHGAPASTFGLAPCYIARGRGRRGRGAGGRAWAGPALAPPSALNGRSSGGAPEPPASIYSFNQCECLPPTGVHASDALLR